MDNCINLMIRKYFSKNIFISNITLNKNLFSRLAGRQVTGDLVHPIIDKRFSVAKVIHVHHSHSAFIQFNNCMRTNKACTSGNENVHEDKNSDFLLGGLSGYPLYLFLLALLFYLVA